MPGDTNLLFLNFTNPSHEARKAAFKRQTRSHVVKIQHRNRRQSKCKRSTVETDQEQPNFVGRIIRLKRSLNGLDAAAELDSNPHTSCLHRNNIEFLQCSLSSKPPGLKIDGYCSFEGCPKRESTMPASNQSRRVYSKRPSNALIPTSCLIFAAWMASRRSDRRAQRILQKTGAEYSQHTGKSE